MSTSQKMLITDEAAWLEKRKGYVTSTEVSALYGLSKWKTAFELWHNKRGTLPEEKIEGNFITFGKIMEQPIVEMINIENPEWKIEPFPYFMFDDADKIGSSFDRLVTIQGKTGLLEIKTISYAKFMEDFIEHSEADIEATPMYEVQMQTELEVAGDYDFIVMAAFIADTRQLKYVFRNRDREVGNEIRAAVREFWSMPEAPEPEWERDKTVIAKVAPFLRKDTQLDATEDTEITELAAQYKASKDLIKQEESAADAAYAKLMMKLGDKNYAWTNTHKISVSDIKANPGKEITEDMVGEIIGIRAGYKRLTITEQKGNKNA